MNNDIATVTVTDGGRIPLTSGMCKKMGIKKGDQMQIWVIQPGVLAVAKVKPIALEGGFGQSVFDGGVR